MVPLRLPLPRSATVLCLGAHADDIEIGCGGTLFQLLRARSDLRVVWVVCSAAGVRAAEARRSATRVLRKARRADIRIHDFPDGRFPAVWADLKDVFQRLARDVAPGVVFTTRLEDRHQDHRVVSELTWNAFRNHLILEYEIAKYEGDLATPNVYVPLDAATRRRKIRHLMQAFPSQHRKPWYSEETFLALLRLRGIESGSATGWAEGFHARKLGLALG